MSENKPNEKTKEDEEIKSFCQSRAIKKAGKVADFLEKVSLDDTFRDVKQVRRKDPETGEWMMDEVECPVPVNVRVTAAKTWKEMIFDKAIGDVKEKAKDTREKGLDMKKAMEAIAAAKAAEKMGSKEEAL